jgi:hypothetical protein
VQLKPRKDILGHVFLESEQTKNLSTSEKEGSFSGSEQSEMLIIFLV